ncbi:MAG: ChbG/HpnK family deacetylase [Candidatus Thiodiazotropha taylori]|nr:ChbG/HpnK family deacetylase [Candidatus Thiodiazotropha taylori]MCG8093322.1 ChbG/HpnK family deacetylase [Candidatus Thiodiazotropha endolucinida]MCG7882769.1 ChbG/HpnK family deacetylase [Candidatus Thiodiazotropha taylori]MCG7885283.1 ChbG/HpnK family deacetylase [Candidatus Thiodiazotropha taylori]MCG7892709.1 ChbG/HpnK family deacetylase [Candidatus Thiodiazotropha taylori]
MPGKVLLVGDDAGVSSSIDDALIELSALGCLDQCHAIVNYPSSPLLVCRLSREIHSLGLHVNLSSGKPLSEAIKIKSLINGGEFLNPANWVSDDNDPVNAIKLLKEVAAEWDVREISLEVEAQMKHFYRFTKKTPVEISVHHDLDELPNVRKAIRLVTDLPTRVEQIERGMLSSYEYEFVLDEMAEDAWVKKIEARIKAHRDQRGVHLIVCHPAYSAKGYEAFSVYRQGRVTEYQALKNIAARGEMIHE